MTTDYDYPSHFDNETECPDCACVYDGKAEERCPDCGYENPYTPDPDLYRDEI